MSEVFVVLERRLYKYFIFILLLHTCKFYFPNFTNTSLIPVKSKKQI